MLRHQIRMVSETRLKSFSFSLLNGLSSWFLAARRVQPPTRPRSRGHNCEGPVLTKKTQEMRRGKPRQGHARLFFSPFPRSIVFSHQSSKCTLILYIGCLGRLICSGKAEARDSARSLQAALGSSVTGPRPGFARSGCAYQTSRISPVSQPCLSAAPTLGVLLGWLGS